MKKLCYLPLIAVLAVTASCNNGNKPAAENQSQPVSKDNPFFKESTLPFQAPDFAHIRTGDFKPALEEGIRQQLADIQKIADNPDTPTFENTVIAMEKSGQLLKRVTRVFSVLTGANTSPELQQVQEEEAPKLAAADDAIYLNPKLFKRIQYIYKERESFEFDAESEKLVEFYYQRFELAGAKLSEEQKEQLKKYNQEEASLSVKFTNQLLAASKKAALVINDQAALDGLAPGIVDAAAQNAKASGQNGKWLLSLQNTTMQPALQSLTNRNTRQQLFEASWTRAEKGDSNDTRKVITRIAEIRAEKAKLMGFPNFATWQLIDQMAQNTQAVNEFLNKLIPATTAKARQEAAELQGVIDRQKGGFQLAPWDWSYYAEQLRKEKYDLDESEVKPYLEVDKVLQDGVFYAASKLYGITFKERKDLPVYQKDVRVFDVFDHDSTQIGLYYCDFFKRDNKSGGAWCSSMVGQSKLLNTKPVIYNVFNFTKPADGQPALVSFTEVTTMFHEFGHALHGLFANQQYPSLSGGNIARDFVEFPSQFNENWASDPEIFRHYAVHYKTGEAMPQPLLDKIKKAANFQQGYALTHSLAAASLDMQWHTLPAGAPVTDVDKFEADALRKTHVDLYTVPPRYRSSYFLHIWGNGYAAGYYAYAWTEMLDHDAFAWFQQHGGLTRENGQRFRDMILSRGSTQNYGEMFRNFTGHNPDIHPMLVYRGLLNK